VEGCAGADCDAIGIHFISARSKAGNSKIPNKIEIAKIGTVARCCGIASVMSTLS
jgi:hypothetical protein